MTEGGMNWKLEGTFVAWKSSWTAELNLEVATDYGLSFAN